MDTKVQEIIRILADINTKTNKHVREVMPDTDDNTELKNVSSVMDNVDDFYVDETYIELTEEEIQKESEKTCVISPNKLLPRAIEALNKVKQNTLAIDTMERLVAQISAKVENIEDFGKSQDIVLQFLQDLKILRNYTNLCRSYENKKLQLASRNLTKTYSKIDIPTEPNSPKIGVYRPQNAQPGGGQSSKYSEQGNLDAFLSIYQTIIKSEYEKVYMDQLYAQDIDTCCVLLEGMRIVNIAPTSNS